MTLTDLQTKRDEILKRVGVVRAQFGDKSVQYGEAKTALEVIDGEINKLQATTNPPRVTFASFSND